MLDTNTKLTVIVDTDTDDFTDHSFSAFDFSRDTFNISPAIDTALYIGFHKPINTFYVSVNEPSDVPVTFTVSYYDGNSWNNVTTLYDDTKGLARSGYITFERPEDSVATSINGVTKHYIKLTATADDTIPEEADTTVEINGINLVFCDDNQLKLEVPEITDTNHLAGKASHILNCYAATQEIIQEFRGRDYTKRDQNGNIVDIDVWDLLDVPQMNQAAVFLTLSKIYFNFSDQADDKYEQKSKAYYEKYKSTLANTKLSLDVNDDGKLDQNERQVSFQVYRIRR